MNEAAIEEEEEEEEAEDEMLLADKKKTRQRPKKKSKAQPATSPARPMRSAKTALLTAQYSFHHPWLLQVKIGALKKALTEGYDGTVMILDTGCAKAMCSRYAFQHMNQVLSDDQVELLPDASTFNFANGQQALAKRSAESGSHTSHLC